MEDTDLESRRLKLEAAFRRLSFQEAPELELRLAEALQRLLLVDTEGSGTLPPRYREHPSKGGRPPNVRARAAAILTGYAYFQLTGNKPTLKIPIIEDDLTPQGPFFALIVEVFEILGLKQSPEHFAKDITASFQVPPPP